MFLIKNQAIFKSIYKYAFILLVIFLFVSCNQVSKNKIIPKSDSIKIDNLTNKNLSEKETVDTLKTNKNWKKELASHWLLSFSWFTDDTVRFERVNENINDYTFHFNKNGDIVYPNKNLGDCPVGFLVINYGKWNSEGAYLNLELKGFIVSDFSFWWKIKYKIIEFTPEKLVLKRIKIIKNVKSKPPKNWEKYIN